MHRFKQPQHRRESLLVGLALVGWNFECAAAHVPPHLRRKSWRNLFQPGGNGAWIAAEERLEKVHRRIKNGMASLQKIDELAHLRFVWRELARSFRHLDKAIAVPRFLYFREKEIQFDEIE